VKKRLDIIITAVACVGVASWFLGYSFQGQPNHEVWTDLAGVGFMVAIVVGLVAIYLEFERRRRSGDQEGTKNPD
jgi:hypothetical protein